MLANSDCSEFLKYQLGPSYPPTLEQAVWRKVQELGLQSAYTNDNKTYKFVRQLLSLPFFSLHFFSFS